MADPLNAAERDTNESPDTIALRNAGETKSRGHENGDEMRIEIVALSKQQTFCGHRKFEVDHQVCNSADASRLNTAAVSR